MRHKISLVIVALIAACSPDNRPVSETEAMDIASLYVEKNYPVTREVPMRPVARDQGKTWIVTYALPDGSIGGTPTVEIDKQTGRVIYARHTQ